MLSEHHLSLLGGNEAHYKDGLSSGEVGECVGQSNSGHAKSWVKILSTLISRVKIGISPQSEKFYGQLTPLSLSLWCAGTITI